MLYKTTHGGQNKIPVLLFTLLTVLPSWASDNFSIYLVRHAEKQSEGKNPILTPCGELRAKQLANLLSQTNIANVYSTSYQRTRQTAQPLATLNKLAVKNYNPRHLEQLALQLKQNKENALIVGHSNTTPVLTELLSGQKVAALTEEDYQYLYQVQFVGGEKTLTLFKQPLVCTN